MSALPPKADILWSERHVRFVPIADIRAFGSARVEKEAKTRCVTEKNWQRLVPGPASCVDYFDFGVASSLSTLAPGTEVLSVP